MTEADLIEQQELGNIDTFYRDKTGNWQVQQSYWVGTGWQRVWREVKAK